MDRSGHKRGSPVRRYREIGITEGVTRYAARHEDNAILRPEEHGHFSYRLERLLKDGHPVGRYLLIGKPAFEGRYLLGAQLFIRHAAPVVKVLLHLLPCIAEAVKLHDEFGVEHEEVLLGGRYGRAQLPDGVHVAPYHNGFHHVVE